MTGLDLKPQFKYSTIICCKDSNIIILDTPIINISVHENDQRVKGLESHHHFYRFFSEIEKNDTKLILMHVDNF